jgi:hypothetical protein
MRPISVEAYYPYETKSLLSNINLMRPIFVEIYYPNDHCMKSSIPGDPLYLFSRDIINYPDKKVLRPE